MGNRRERWWFGGQDTRSGKFRRRNAGSKGALQVQDGGSVQDLWMAVMDQIGRKETDT